MCLGTFSEWQAYSVSDFSLKSQKHDALHSSKVHHISKDLQYFALKDTTNPSILAWDQPLLTNLSFRKDFLKDFGNKEL